LQICELWCTEEEEEEEEEKKKAQNTRLNY
jgi:hypothetical protein